MTQSIPVVNLEHFRFGTRSQKEIFVNSIGDALKDLGFFALEGHSIEPTLISRAYQMIQDFFDLPLEKKNKYEIPGLKGQRGYTSFGKEHAKDSNAPDLKEFWHVGREYFTDYKRLDLYPKNIWPSEIPDFKNTMLLLFKKLEQCTADILHSCALYIGEDENLFSDMAVDGNTILRVIHYPPIADDKHPDSVRAAAHEDINLITLLCEATTSGLELLQRDGRWRPIQALKGQIVVDTGDMMQNLTNGILRSTTHRVTNPDNSRERRFSMPFFVHPRSEIALNPLKSCIAKVGKQRYPAISAGQYLEQRLKEIGLS